MLEQPPDDWAPTLNADDPLTPTELERIHRRDKDEAVSPRDWERLRKRKKGPQETLC